MRITDSDPPENLMRLGTHLEKHFFDNGDAYDGIVVNANVVEAFASAIAGLLARFQKPFVIDPITYGFAMPPTNMMGNPDPKTNKREPKKTFLRLAYWYAEPLYKRLSAHQPTLLHDLETERVQEDLCRNVLSFQRERLMTALREKDDEEYLVFGRGEVRPKALLAPYFYMETLEDGWFDLNLSLAKRSVAAAEDIPLYAMICVSPDLLNDEESAQKLALSYRKLDCAGYFLWLSDFIEDRAKRTVLRTLVRFLNAFQHKAVYNAYGGYLSQLLAFKGITGTCHGPGYGEHRDVLPVGGGLPSAQYYVRPIRKRMVYAEAELIVPDSVEDFYARICDCSVCRALVKNDMGGFEEFGKFETKVSERGRKYTYSTPDSIRNCAFHYLQVKKREYSEIATAIKNGTVSTINSSLQTDAQWLKPRVGDHGIAHLKLWQEVLQAG